MRLQPINFAHYRLFLIYLFVFLGPIGNMLTPGFLPYQFRTFYFLLPLFPLFYSRLTYQEIKTLLTFLPLLLYCFASSFFTELTPPMHVESSPIYRGCLFVCESLFMFGAAFTLRFFPLAEEKNRLIRLFLYAFFISLIIGYFFFLGYYAGLIRLTTIQRFSVITQFGYGLLRFSPGSYPNEYGTVASFVTCILTLLTFERKNKTFQIGLRKKSLYPFLILSFIALLLTTTRAAYVSFILGIVYLFFVSASFRKALAKYTLILTALFLLFKNHLQFLIDVYVLGFTKLSHKLGSFGIRVMHWKEGLDAFEDTHLWGRGFASLFYIHNVYFELIMELGLIGMTLLVSFGLSYFVNHSHAIRKIFFKRWMDPQQMFSNRVIVLGLIHIFWFAASNHNINHHLTWMVFLLFNMNLFSKEELLTSHVDKNAAYFSSTRVRNSS